MKAKSQLNLAAAFGFLLSANFTKAFCFKLSAFSLFC
jgi:hypothetical protein